MPTVKASEEIAVQMYITQNITVFNYPNFEIMCSPSKMFLCSLMLKCPSGDTFFVFLKSQIN